MRKKYVCHVFSLVELCPLLISSIKSIMDRNIALTGEARVWTSARCVIFSFIFVPYFCLSPVT